MALGDEMRLRLRRWLVRQAGCSRASPRSNPKHRFLLRLLKPRERLARLNGELRGSHDIKIFVWRNHQRK